MPADDLTRYSTIPFKVDQKDTARKQSTGNDKRKLIRKIQQGNNPLGMINGMNVVTCELNACLSDSHDRMNNVLFINVSFCALIIHK